MAADKRVICLRIDIPHREGFFLRRHDVLRHVKPDISHAAIVNAAFDVVDVLHVDLNKGNDVMPLLPIEPVRCTFLEDVRKDVLFIAARALSALRRILSAPGEMSEEARRRLQRVEALFEEAAQQAAEEEHAHA